MRALVLLAAGVAAAVGALGVAAHGSDVCRSVPPFDVGKLGAVAYWRGSTVRVVDVATGADRLVIRDSGRRIVGSPLSWSADGRWIASGDLIASAADGSVCRPLGDGASITQWLPGGRLVGTTAKGVFIVGGPGRRPRVYRGVGGGVVDPAGTRIAVSGTGRTLWLVTLATGKRRLLYRSPSAATGVPVPRAWTSDGRWVLFANDEYGSSSIAADGLPLLTVRASGGRAVRIERRVLLGSDFVQPCGRDGFVVSAGFDRYVSAHKRVDLVAPPSWRPRNVSRDASRSWYSASCSPDGRWIAATVTRNREEPRFDTAERSIWLLATDGSRRRLLVGKPGDGLSDEAARWSRDGRSILFVEHPARPHPRGRLFLVDVVSGRRRGPLGQVDGGLGYYGYRDWSALATWFQPR